MRIFKKHKKKISHTGLPFIQPKLNIGKRGDRYEVEADAVADKLVKNSTSNEGVQKMEGGENEEELQQKPLAASISPLLQKQADTAEEENVQTKCSDCDKEDDIQRNEEEEEALQTKSESKNTKAINIQTALRQSKGGGNKLPVPLKNDMEASFGTDFSQVKIHTDAHAVQMSKQLNAQAFTNGNDIYFNEGKFNPASKKGKHLLAHELTHTIQQNPKKDKAK